MTATALSETLRDLRQSVARLEASIAPISEPVAFLHEIVSSDGDGETDSALSFSRDSFPLDTVTGYRSIGVRPLIYGDRFPVDRIESVLASAEPVAWMLITKSGAMDPYRTEKACRTDADLIDGSVRPLVFGDAHAQPAAKVEALGMDSSIDSPHFNAVAWFDTFNAYVYFDRDEAQRAHDGGNTVLPIESMAAPTPASAPDGCPQGEVACDDCGGREFGVYNKNAAVLFCHGCGQFTTLKTTPRSHPMITAEELSRFPDTFNGGDEHLVRCIEALLSLDATGTLVPHGIGGHARGLLSAAMHRLATQSRAAGAQGVAYDRELIATMLHEGASVQKFAADAIREQIRLLRAADNADAAGVRTVSRPPKDAGAVALPAKMLAAMCRGSADVVLYSDAIRYGNAREDAGRADAVPGYPEAAEVCGEAYQVVGSLLSDLGIFETERARKILDNLSQHRMVHRDVLPWAACEPQHPPAEPETTAADNDLVQVERGLLGAACSAIAKKRDAPKVLEALRKITMTPRAELADSLFVGAVKKLVIASRTSGGTAGRDDGLCAALDAVEAMLAEPAARAQVGDLDSVMRARGLPCVSDALGYSRNFAYANPALSQTTRDHIEGLCNMLEIAAANPSPAHAGTGDAEALARKIFEAHREQCRRTPLWPMSTWDECEQSTRDHWTNIARRLAGGKA